MLAICLVCVSDHWSFCSDSWFRCLSWFISSIATLRSAGGIFSVDFCVFADDLLATELCLLDCLLKGFPVLRTFCANGPIFALAVVLPLGVTTPVVAIGPTSCIASRSCGFGGC